MRGISILMILSIFIMSGCFDKKEIREFPEEVLASRVFTLAGKESTVKDALAEYKGKPVVLKLWAGWCSDCIKSVPKFNEFQDNHSDVNFVLFSVDHQEKAWKKAVNKFKVEGNHYRLDTDKKWKNGTFAKAIDLGWIPRYLILDSDGNIASEKHIIEVTDPSLEKVLSEL